MKKFLTLALAAVMLFTALPAAFAVDTSKTLALDASSALKVNAETGYIENMPEIMTVSELLTNFRDKKDITVTDAKGNALKSTDEVGTDAVISCGDSSVKTLVYGDVNRDCKINMKDISSMIRYLASYDVDIVEAAMDVNFDGNRNMKDISAMIRYLAGWNVDIRNHDILDPLTAPNEDSDIEILFDSIMHRVGATDTEPSDNYTYTLKMAKNELETLQFFLVSAAEKTDLTLEVGDITNENGDILEAEALYGYYYDSTMFNCLAGGDTWNTNSDYYTDPLPKLVNPISLKANQSKSFAVKVKTTPDTATGLYKAAINLTDADGNVIKTAEFRVYVWGFVLEEETACATAFGLSTGAVNMTDGTPEYYDSEVITQKYKTYYDYMLDNRVNAYRMPYAVTDSRADVYMSNPRVTSFTLYIPGYGGEYYASEEDIVSDYAKLCTNEDWLDKAYLYPVDEPWKDEHYEELERFCLRMRELMPDLDFNVIVPFGNSYYSNLKMDTAERIKPFVNIWCPSNLAYKPYVTYAQRKENPELYPEWMYKTQWMVSPQFEKFGQWADRAETYRERGDKIWWYTCEGPEFPHPNFFQAYQGCIPRLFFWQQYMNDIDGLLYWAVNFWEKVSKNRSGSDGVLLYWGDLFGQGFGPVTSVRFECVRDGIEDFQYFTQLEELTDRGTSMEYVNRLTTETLRFDEDYRNYEAVRAQVGFYLEELYGAAN